MHPIKHDHNRHHKHRIKHIQKDFVTEQIPRVSLQVFNDAENTPDHDESRRDVQIVQVSFPRKIVEIIPMCKRRGGRSAVKLSMPLRPNLFLQRNILHQPIMKNPCHNNEEPKEEKLRKQPRDDKFLACM
jgi:hypothetical protein